jgi:uncharacterized protein
VASSLPDRLQVALKAALKERDAAAVSALRSALAAIGNAEALPAPPAESGRAGQYVAGSVAGLGAAEASRRHLTEAEIAAIVRTEIADRHAAAAGYEQAGHADRVDRLRREADALAALVSGNPAGRPDSHPAGSPGSQPPAGPDR